MTFLNGSDFKLDNIILKDRLPVKVNRATGFSYLFFLLNIHLVFKFTHKFLFVNDKTIC